VKVGIKLPAAILTGGGFSFSEKKSKRNGKEITRKVNRFAGFVCYIESKQQKQYEM